jgi:hypothetical protein
MNNVIPRVRVVMTGVLFVLAAGLGAAVEPAAAQRVAEAPERRVVRLVAEPAELALRAGEERAFHVTAYDAQGRAVPEAAIRIGGPRMAVFFGEGVVRGLQAGNYTAVATWSPTSGGAPVTLEIPVTVVWPTLSRLAIEAEPGRLYTGVMLHHVARGFDADGMERKGFAATWRSSDPAVASVDRFGNVTAHRPGTVTITASAENVTAEHRYTVAASPVARVEIEIPQASLVTGEAIELKATPRRADGSPVNDAPVTWSYTYRSMHDSIAAVGGAGIIDHGLFAANAPGLFTLIAESGGALARKVIDVAPRDVQRRISVTGRGSITSTHTSDLWPWTGKDGRDYALVGTWGGDGYAFIFDITDMGNIVKTDSVRVDARTINDVTISPDGRYGVIAREGASNRINGVVLLDLANPAHPKIASSFSEELTGGVHNMFATDDYLFAVSGGSKYVIIDVRDIYNPKYVSEYRHPNARLHDLWVHDGIAYSAQGGAGTVVVDVGNGAYGGTIEKPKLITVYPINSGHEIYPYFQRSTGKVYLFIGDEFMSRAGRVWEGTNYRDEMYTPGGVPQTSGGYTHIVDFTDPMNPKKVARYHLEDYGSHDIIVEDDVLYQAYYDGGVRLVDVSGLLLGNLADQRREIAVYKPFDPQGFTANAPFVMNAMPWKGHVLFTDFNSGLWAAKLEPKERVTF